MTKEIHLTFKHNKPSCQSETIIFTFIRASKGKVEHFILVSSLLKLMFKGHSLGHVDTNQDH